MKLIHILFLVLLCLVSAHSVTHAETMPKTTPDPHLDMSGFKNLPVLQDGRIKPLDTFARHELLRFSGKSSLKDQSAIDWLAETLFDPVTAADRKIFKIENETVRHLLELEERKKPLYAFSELTKGLEKTFPMVEQLMNQKPSAISKDQKALLTLHENALEYTQILRSFSQILPLNITVPAKYHEQLDLKKGQLPTYLDLKKIDPELQTAIKKIIKSKGQNPEKYTPLEQQTAILGWQIQTIENAASGNALLKIIPNDWDRNKDDYIAPWEMISSGQGSPQSAVLLAKWKTLSTAYATTDNMLWTKTTADLRTTTGKPLELETAYNSLHPFNISLGFFALSFVLALLSLSFGTLKHIKTLSLIALLIALIAQTGGLTARIILLERPPVGTLYESILFVGLVGPLFALLVEYRLKNALGLICGGLMGTTIGLLAITMADEGDNMKVLTAVLNTQFWLTTHVLCITIGYGWCLLTSVLAHMILIGQKTGKLDAAQNRSLKQALGTLAITSLLFTATGTILGGIWADQSWGRFWGWDPKENGALLIVLWLVWLIHGKIAAQISETLYTIGMAFLSVIVGTAWIGVNLLGIGLHSYGFIEGVFWGLGIFTLAEISILVFLGLKITNKDTSHAA